jgi:rhodanese-related sulfurtransferase
VAVLVLVTVVVIAADLVFGSIFGTSGGAATPSPTASPSNGQMATATPTASSTQFGVVVQGEGGYWTNVTPDQLAEMLAHKDFTLLNVKKPYYAEIEGTDLYIPYDQLAARASELPSDKNAKILIYCRTGTTSKIGAQTLLDLGYTDIWNLDGGMVAWTASGRTLVNLNRP